MTKPLPSQKLLKRLLRYDPATGALHWRTRSPYMFEDGKQSAAHRCAKWNSRLAGKPAFTTLCNGYFCGRINNVGYKAHRIIWKMQTGCDPVGVDHRDGNPANNRWQNLREANQAVNSKNAAKRSDNKSGIVGVSWDAERGKWFTRIGTGKGSKALGRFSCIGLAIRRRRAAEKEFGYSKRHGRA